MKPVAPTSVSAGGALGQKKHSVSAAKKPNNNKRIEAIIEDPERENEKAEGSVYQPGGNSPTHSPDKDSKADAVVD